MTDTKDTLVCPACDKEMKKVYIKNAGINIDICIDGCGGMFFDNRELEKFDEEHENADDILKAVEEKEFEHVNNDEIRICPICNIPMVKLGGIGSVKIDACNICGGKFLDNGELKRLREEKSEINSKKEELFNKLEQIAYDKTMGNVGNFVNNNIPRTKFREAFEFVIRKFV